MRSGFSSQLHPYILNKIWFFSCDRILKQAIYVPDFSTSQNRVAPQADLDMLELAAATGEIDLKYLDESGFSVWSEPGYTYYFRGEQKRLEQTLRRGRRLSIIGFLQPFISFVYGLVIGGVDRKSYIKMMEQEATEAQEIGRKSVGVFPC